MPVRPVFIVGCFRSGTTLVRLILNSHSRICVSDEARYLAKRIPASSVDSGYTQSEAEKLIQVIRRTLKRQRWQSVPSAMEIMSHIRAYPVPLAEIAEVVASYPWKKQDLLYWGDNTPVYIEHWETIASRFPGAKFVNLIRDPRDVVASSRSIACGFGFSVYSAASIWRKRAEIATRMAKTIGNNFISIRYEDIVSNPNEEVIRLCRFLGIEYENSMLQYNQSDEAMNMAGGQPHHKNVVRPVNTSSIGKYMNILSDHEIGIVERVCATWMERFGYKCSIVDDMNEVSASEKLSGIIETFFLQICDRVYQITR
ncbi:sulfotransferase [Thiohalobacter sp. COW1]|uniref:sulfotransferase family protein n=1 Tax=Thiohalobacter sp. COW1 TaxID=2795687 RepID=UPI001915F37E|nr:sulfotransferase [Thiohalobacter sp. COW1]